MKVSGTASVEMGVFVVTIMLATRQLVICCALRILWKRIELESRQALFHFNLQPHRIRRGGVVHHLE